MASGAAAAGLAALPLTIGFFKDELFFGAALERGAVFAALAVVGAALTFAYVWRFWSGIFLGSPRDGAHAVPAALVWPVAVLGALVLFGGVFVEPFAALARAAGAASFTGSVDGVEPAYHLDARPENLMALATFALGAVLIFSRPVWEGRRGVRPARGEVRAGASLRGLHPQAQRALGPRAPDRDPGPQEPGRGRLRAGGVLVGLGFLVTPTAGVYRLGAMEWRDAPLLLALVAVAVSAITATYTRRHVTLALVLSSAGYVLAAVYAFFGAPDVALVAVLIETVVTLLFIATLKLIPYKVLHHQAGLPLERRRRKVYTAVVAGAFAFVVVWGTLSQPSPDRGAAAELTRLTPDAHGKDVVTVILADFRGLDTLGEITVVALVLLGVATLLRRGRLR
ncbi:hydrogen gas-evolving membrane-bound hydrogenase subunit E [Rubrobacter marinus]|uniref:hydrogen gas-evolving membrane-bound hydrogenase subunit E n=1 Tax=Rubrobacter marinus TaxID=2653852 RepID=UPI001D1821A9|nr:hydrogen gas-evolving membrane-bound hydrogenase subunit E [Rubrobacter marinus]